MSDIHIDDFYKDLCRILVQLYSYFPRRATLFVEDICGPDEPDEFGMHSPRHQSCLGAMLWLADAGYIAYEDTIRQEALDQVILTHKAFTLLSAPSPLAQLSGTEEVLPPSVQAELQSHIALLRNAIKSGSSTEQRKHGYQLLLQAREFA